jgi:hypothetical protein
MKNLLSLFFIVVCGSVAFGQSGDAQLITEPFPHPYISFGPSLMPAGYAPLAYRAEAGIDVESTHFMLHALGAYDNGRKDNDNDQPNPNGHDRYLEGAAYFRASSHWFVGGGWRWDELSTTNYFKSGSRPEFGGGYDWFVPGTFSMRIDAEWLTAGNDWQNGSHGPNVTVTFPAPSEKHHIFWRQSVGIYSFHETVTDPTNLALTQAQRSDKSIDATVDGGLILRF